MLDIFASCLLPAANPVFFSLQSHLLCSSPCLQPSSHQSCSTTLDPSSALHSLVTLRSAWLSPRLSPAQLSLPPAQPHATCKLCNKPSSLLLTSVPRLLCPALGFPSLAPSQCDLATKMNPADTETLHQAMAIQDTVIGQHDQALKEIMDSLRDLSANISSLCDQLPS